MSDAHTEGIRFAEIVTGTTVTDAAPPPGSPLARLIELGRQRIAENRSQEWLNEQARKLLSPPGAADGAAPGIPDPPAAGEESWWER